MIDGHRDGGDTAAAPFPLWSFRDDVLVEAEPDGPVVVRSRSGDVAVGQLPPPVLAALRRMSLGPIALSNVISEEADRSALDDVLQQLEHLVVRSVGLDPEHPLVSFVPLTPYARARWPTTPVVRPVRLSRFAMIRTDGANYLVESPLSLHRAILHQAEAVARVGRLIRPVAPGSVDPATLAVITHLVAVGLAVEAVSNGALTPFKFVEDTDPALAAWSPVDLLFHTRSTIGRHDDDFGATYPMGEQWQVEPVVKPPLSRPGIPLPRPEWDRLTATDPPLSVAIEATRDSHHYGCGALTVGELGELLYRAARVRSLVDTTGEEPAPGPTSMSAASDRPYPSIDRSYELEIYAAVDRCDSVPRGIYHYDPLRHQLEPLNATPDDVDELLGISRVAAHLSSTPAVSLTITARFRRVLGKYSGLGYATVLVNVGALTELLSLVSTTMGLASRRVDGGELEASPRILGLNWPVESSVGGFVLGRPADPPVAPVAPAASAAEHPTRAVNDPGWAGSARAMRS